jgi:hypothetical protein
MAAKMRIQFKNGERDGERIEIDSFAQEQVIYTVWPGHEGDLNAVKNPADRERLRESLARLAYQFAELVPSPVDGVPEMIYRRAPHLDKPATSSL